MDNRKFGTFVATLRKEKGLTQQQLAEELCVTDKAISKWERGLGYPDIKLVEPLAEILGVSVIEIMRSERTDEEQVNAQSASEAITNMIDVVDYQRKIERRNVLIAVTTFALTVMSLFLIDTMDLVGFVLACLPIAMFAVGIVLILVSVKRKKLNLSYATPLTLGIFAIAFPIIIVLLMVVAFILGGPLPG
ncbi:MAG: helix-turn-helix domain-containing protein [Lachnospiraceae bacterium]|nr:helix-turn-helix domain-containing protein [Lachnospiraceae bacterium]